MHTRTRIALPSVVLLVAGFASACGGSGAPTDASEKEFCDAQMSIFEDLMPDMSEMDLEDLESIEQPSNDEMADSMHKWADEIEKVGTPEDISDDARAGFEKTVEQAGDVEAADFAKAEEDNDFNPFEEELSGEEEKQAEAYDDYVTETCGDPFDDSELPEMPEVPESTE